MAGIVWVLGAGFSIPLGGPLFRDLISDTIFSRMRDRLPDKEARTWAQIVVKIYDSGCPTEQRQRDPKGNLNQVGPEIWKDAEVFLEAVELLKGNPDSSSAKFIATLTRNAHSQATVGHVAPSNECASVVSEALRNLHREAVRFCAIACSYFLADAEALHGTSAENRAVGTLRSLVGQAFS